MDGVKRGVAVETERSPEESAGAGIELEGWRDTVELIAIVALVMLLAAATSVVLLPA